MSRILIADDESSIRFVLREALEGAGNEVEEARDGEEAYQAACEHQPDLIITDLQMPYMSGLELARRLDREHRDLGEDIRSPSDVHRRYGPMLRDLVVEEFHLLTLDAQNRVTRQALITRGILNSSLVHPREVFRAAIAEAAAGIIVVHNHPSGNPAPSADDKTVTTQLVEAGKLLDMPVYDHVIVAGDHYFSFAEAGLL
ncbi:MAG: response regulator [candidate division NC10 bacterium]|nr:response regulator [candidate division NC10 bacterium]